MDERNDEGCGEGSDELCDITDITDTKEEREQTYQPHWWKWPTLKIGLAPQAGRFVYTTKDIGCQDVILTESPIVVGDGKAAIEKIRATPDLHILHPVGGAFAPPLTPRDSSTSKGGARGVCPPITPLQAKSILEFNCFMSGRGKKSSSLYLCTSMFNHSCCPNVTFQNLGRGSTMMLHALRDIKAGEELCISYCGLEPLVANKTSRQKELKTWFDACACPVCAQPASSSTQPLMKTLLTPLLRSLQSIDNPTEVNLFL